MLPATENYVLAATGGTDEVGHMSYVGCLSDLLRECAECAETAPPAGPAPTWLRYDLATEPLPPALYRILADTSASLLATGDADDAFFVHTPDGLRVRCRTGRPAAADDAWQGTLAEAERRGWLRAWRPATHEPQQFGLGGPRAMASAHRVFTADSAAWLGYHSDPERPTPTIARWAMSVLMIRSVLTGAVHAGWETADVWDRVARTVTRAAGRRLADDPAVRRLAHAVRAGWDEPDLLRSRLSGAQRMLLARYDTAVRAAAADWRDAPAPGPVRRHGLALAVVFHWNRSAMPAQHQRLLATALSGASTGASAAARTGPVAA
jgi:thiopeptide-type bacteriocin biosynthesis protein